MASGVKIRRFEWKDINRLTYLFNEINGLSDTEKAFDVEYMRQFLSVPPCDPREHCFLAQLDGEAVGFTLIEHEKPISRAVASGGVLKKYRRRGIGRQLLKKAIAHSSSLEVSVLHVEVSSQSAEARHLLESEGFQPTKTYWQMRWTGDEAPPPDLPGGFSLRPFLLGQDEEALTELQNAAFGDNWGFSPNTVEQISARVRLNRCDPEGIIFITENGRIAAYNWTMISANDRRATGFISMTGVHPDYRGKGLGTAIVAAGMDYLKARDVDAIELEVDAANAPARELYLKLGFQKAGESVWYEKRFES